MSAKRSVLAGQSLIVTHPPLTRVVVGVVSAAGSHVATWRALDQGWIQVVAEVVGRLRHADQVDRGAVHDCLHAHAELRGRFVDDSGRSAVDQVLERVE